MQDTQQMVNSLPNRVEVWKIVLNFFFLRNPTLHYFPNYNEYIVFFNTSYLCGNVHE